MIFKHQVIFCVSKLRWTSQHVGAGNNYDGQTNIWSILDGHSIFIFIFFPIAALWKFWKCNAIQQIKKTVALFNPVLPNRQYTSKGNIMSRGMCVQQGIGWGMKKCTEVRP